MKNKAHTPANVREYNSAEKMKINMPSLPEISVPPTPPQGPNFTSQYAKNVREMMKKTEEEMKNII